MDSDSIFRSVSIAGALLILAACSRASETVSYRLMQDRPAAVGDKALAKFSLSQKQIVSVKLKLTAYNGDPEYRSTVDLRINGIGGAIAYTIAENVADGYVPARQKRTWMFDLGKNYGMFMKRNAPGRSIPTFLAVQDSDRIIDVNYMEMLSRTGEHALSCHMDAPGSKVSAELVVEYGNTARRQKMNAPVSIESDSLTDIRVRLAVSKLKRIAGQQRFSGYKYVIGKRIAEPLIGKQDMADLGNEGYIIKWSTIVDEWSTMGDGRPSIVVTGNDYQGVAYGVFRLARIMASAPEQLASINLRVKPALEFREIYEEHGWANPRDLASYKLLLNRYLEEGINTMDLPVGWFITPQYYLKGKSSKDAENLEVVKKVIEYAHSLGIKVFIVEDAYLNPLYNEKPENLANIDPGKLADIQCLMESRNKEPLLLCLNNPISRDLIKRNREMLYSYFTDADGFVIYFGDPGGCYHKECLPHGEKIIQYMSDIYVPLFKATRPDMQVILSMWGIGLEDTEYVVKHITELPKNVIAIQIPPTNMRAGDYLTFERQRGDLMREAGRSQPVILQQFYEGVGFRNGWVDLWEHPMPREMSESFRGTWKPDSGIVGTYASSFDVSDQLVDLRIGMEWGWHPTRDAFEIVKEFGDEQFGLGAGEGFAKAMYSMDDYWSREVKRFHFDTGALSDADLADLTKSLNDAVTAKDQLVQAEKSVKGNRIYFKSFTELAELMFCNARVTMLRDKAARLSASGDKGEAMDSARQVLAESERAVGIAKASERYGRLTEHAWWSWWDIGKRPERIRQIIADLEKAPGK